MVEDDEGHLDSDEEGEMGQEIDSDSDSEHSTAKPKQITKQKDLEETKSATKHSDQGSH